MIAWTLFYHPMELPAWAQLWLILPLCIAVALVYKALRVKQLKALPRDLVLLLAYMAGGLVSLAVVLWAVSEYWP